MEYGKTKDRHISRCLACGEQIRYGRTDKKYCCEDCRIRHHNILTKGSRAFRRRTLSILSRNYAILEEFIKYDVRSVEISDLLQRGFVPGIVTSYRKVRKHDEYCCFDIKYIMTETRIYGISKIQNVSLPLQISHIDEDQTI